VWLQVKVGDSGLGLRPKLYASLSVTQSADTAAVCGLWRYIGPKSYAFAHAFSDERF